MGTETLSNLAFSKRIHTIESLAAIESFTTGLFCLEKPPAFISGPECLLREGSAEVQPIVLPSSPPATTLNNLTY